MQAAAPTACCVPASPALALAYVAAILPTVKVRAVADSDARVNARKLALGLPKQAWRTITWRDGSPDPLCSRFARVRVRTAPIRGAAARPEETLLIEWPSGEPAPSKYWLANVDRKISFRELVDIAKMRWRIERDYQDLKQEGRPRMSGRPMRSSNCWRTDRSNAPCLMPPTRGGGDRDVEHHRGANPMGRPHLGGLAKTSTASRPGGF
jgi:hypothetical protein